MKQTLTIRTRPKRQQEMVRIRKARLSQRLYQKLFGIEQQITILVPGDEIASVEIKEEEILDESDETVTSHQR
ncbi:hypothetical protein HZY91_05025 [Facklamia sp. DSM 111018]|uniref:Uncharacterized protein n=1 Tax=Facklamia lactis TaxID=2749967 RepID=A0ABS0LSM2_9LACT|nr:hypothetical protein [Facklamia lactis]MBG9986254.1 hypothetical protein [Facklamia lactis]